MDIFLIILKTIKPFVYIINLHNWASEIKNFTFQQRNGYTGPHSKA